MHETDSITFVLQLDLDLIYLRKKIEISQNVQLIKVFMMEARLTSDLPP